MVSTPSPPDPTEVATAQTNANVNSAVASTVMNNANENTPWGKVRYNKIGHSIVRDPSGKRMRIPKYSRTTTLSPQEQRKLTLSNDVGIGVLTAMDRQVGNIKSTLAKPVDTSGAVGRVNKVGGADFSSYGNAPGLQNFKASTDLKKRYASNDFSKDRRRVERALLSRLEGDYDRDRDQLETRLVNQGLTRGTEAFNDAMDEMRRAETDSRYQAVLAGGQEQSRLLGEAREAANFYNTAEQQQFQNKFLRKNYNNTIAQQGFDNVTRNKQLNDAAALQDYQTRLSQAEFQNAQRAGQLQEIYAERNQPLNEMAAAVSGHQVNAPQFQNMYRQGIQPAPIGEYMYRSAEMEAANSQAAMGGLFGLGSSLMGGLFALSDARAKENIKPVGKTQGGLNLYSYNYKGDPATHIGPMAQEVAVKQPEAAGQFSNGLLGVDYSAIK